MIHIIIIILSNLPVVYLLDVIVSVQLLVIHYELQLPAYKEYLSTTLLEQSSQYSIHTAYQFLCGLPKRQGVAGRATMADRNQLYAVINNGRYGSNSTTPS